MTLRDLLNSGATVFERLRALVGWVTLPLLVLAALPASAQELPQHRVGVLVAQPLSWDEVVVRKTLSDLGYRDGTNLTFIVRSADAQLARLPALAADLVKANPHVILAFNTPGAHAAMAATRTIPIIIVEVGDPIATGLVTNLARPEGNVTGVTNLCGELAGKRLSLLKQAVSAARRIAVMLNPADAITTLQVKDTERSAQHLGIEVRFFHARSPADISSVLDSMLEWRPDALMWLCGQQAAMELRTVELAPKHRLPVMAYRSEAVQAGALMSYAPNRAESMRRAAIYVDKILQGAKPGALPVQQPTQLELTINLKTAKALGLTIAPALRLQAHKVIE